ncbi:hydroxymethylbilane synthase [Streptomyces sp. NPDC059631]|uniref:hydroxymethylbilane synthase n=1 Tax=unclassified Streptomyces TaxID=2593676 RepID=UPI00369EDADB
MTRTFFLGTRPSPMALEQTGRFSEVLTGAQPGLDLEVVHISSEGDEYTGPLTEIGGKGAFTRRADRRLLERQVDATIACAKDLPSPHDRLPGISVGAVLPREAVADVLITPAGHGPATLADLPAGTRVGTSAPRRAALLRALHPHLVAVPIRGNADSRLGRLGEGALGVDVMIAALAGMGRLGLTRRIGETLDPAVWLPAAGAGIVVIEHRDDDPATAALLAPLTHPPTHRLLLAERAALAVLHGGCLTAASAHAVHDPATDTITVHAVVLDPDGGDPLRASAAGPAADPARAGGEAGRQLLDVGADRLLGTA